MGEMIGAIAHQWKQPLNAIALNVQIMELDEECNKNDLNFCIENTKKQVEYMAKTIDDFRNFFQPNKTMQRFLLKGAIDNVLELFQKQLEVHNIQVNIENVDVYVFGYKNELEQVLINLIKNAKDAFDEIDKNNKYIKIYTKIDSNVYIFVEDNAGGIKKEIVDKIFTPYFTTKEKGTGIGLYISKMIIEDMQGEISVDSYDDKTMFAIKLLRG